MHAVKALTDHPPCNAFPTPPYPVLRLSTGSPHRARQRLRKRTMRARRRWAPARVSVPLLVDTPLRSCVTHAVGLTMQPTADLLAGGVHRASHRGTTLPRSIGRHRSVCAMRDCNDAHTSVQTASDQSCVPALWCVSTQEGVCGTEPREAQRRGRAWAPA